MRRILHISLLILILSASSYVYAQSEKVFYGASVNVTEVRRPSSSSEADSDFKVRHAFKGKTPTYQNVKGHGAPIDMKTIGIEGTLFSLSGEPITTSFYEGNAKISKARLQCSQPQDVCFGCVVKYLTGTKWPDDIKNIHPDSKSYKVLTRYDVYRSNSGTPIYNGPLYIRLNHSASAGELQSIDLKQYISWNSSYHCSLVPPTFQIGIASYPAALSISDDCILRWDTSQTNIGGKYAVQFRIISDTQGPRPPFAPASWKGCFPSVEVAMTIEIGCNQDEATSNPDACFLCSHNSTSDILSSLQDTSAQYKAKIKKVKRKMVRLIKKTKTFVPLRLKKFLRRKSKKLFKKSNSFLTKLLTENIFATQGVFTQCLAASPIMCESTSFESAKDELRNANLELLKLARKGARLRKTTLEALGKKGKKAKKWKARYFQKIQNIYEQINQLIDSLPSKEDHCGLLR
ncbi:MAG: hypothetical protein D6780_03715 [Candidatus Dadabacteria bacterium]|nr:MAG: hypothetical protein D6780_03715 [Candidatus Dadabacteria bacterium]